MSTGQTHRLPSVERGREPDLTAQATTPHEMAYPGRDFFWGVATSGYQSEGGFNGPGEPLNNWAWAEAAGDVVPSGRTSDFWNLSHEDFGRCREMGLNSFRLSVEWSRIQPATVLGGKTPPAGVTPPPFDERALYSYAQRLADCRAHGIEPIVTLHHFVYPAWLGQDAWLDPATIEHFAAFVEHTVRYFLRTLPQDFGCAPPRWFITINEPNLQAFNHYLYRIFPSGKIGLDPTVQCLATLLEAHVRVYRLIHRLYAEYGSPDLPKPMVSFNNYCSDLYWSDTAMIDFLFAPSRKIPREKLRDDLVQRAACFDHEFTPRSSSRCRARAITSGSSSSRCTIISRSAASAPARGNGCSISFTRSPPRRSTTSPSITTTRSSPTPCAGRAGATSTCASAPSATGCWRAWPASGGTGRCCRRGFRSS
jgi:hypothetical protein